MSLLVAAWEYAKQGQPVFPCRPANVTNDDGILRKAKSPLTRNGLHDATTDETTIHTWWKRWPHAQIGLPTGLVYDVLDVDNKAVNGYATVRLLREKGLIPEQDIAKVVKTPSGGMHLYFATSNEMGNGAFAKFGVDLRGTGGYVIAPPSVQYDEAGAEVGAYTLLNEQPRRAPLDWRGIRALLAPPVARRATYDIDTVRGLGGLDKAVRDAKEGERNHLLFWAACRAVEQGLDPFDLTDAAHSVGLTDTEVQATINSAMRTVSA